MLYMIATNPNFQVLTCYIKTRENKEEEVEEVEVEVVEEEVAGIKVVDSDHEDLIMIIIILKLKGMKQVKRTSVKSMVAPYPSSEVPKEASLRWIHKVADLTKW